MSSPTGRSETPFGLAALAAVGLGVCCGIPILLATGTTVTIAGIGISNWLLVLAGLIVAAIAVTLNLRRHADSRRVAKESVDTH